MKNPPPDAPDSVPVLMSMEGKLVFTSEGQWLHDGKPVTHDKIHDYFSRCLHWSPEHGSYVIEAGGRCVAVEVEDTPIVIRTLDLRARPWIAALSTGVPEPFAADTIEVSPEGVFYARVDGGRTLARLLRPAWQALLPFVRQSENGEFELYWPGPGDGSPRAFRIHSRSN